jgi:hypothetical protein
MTAKKLSSNEEINELVKNLDYSLRVKEIKTLGVFSDKQGEGKSTFICACIPLMAKIYNKKILVLDMGTVKTDNVARYFTLDDNEETQLNTRFDGVDYISHNLINQLNTSDQLSSDAKVSRYLNDTTKLYDLVVVNTNTLRRAEKTVFPEIVFDGAVLLRTDETVGKESVMVNEIIDRSIPIIGTIHNEGLQ